MPCDQRERCRKTPLYGHQRSLSGPQRVYCFDCMSRSGPNIRPPNSIAAVAAALSHTLPVSPHAAANVGGANTSVTMSCVFPEGIGSAAYSTHCAAETSRLPARARACTLGSFVGRVMGKKGKTQEFLGLAAAPALLAGLGALPRPAAVSVGRALGRAAYRVAGALRRPGLRTLQLAF